MDIVCKEINYYSRTQKFEILPLGDIHVGNTGFDKGKLLTDINYIKNTPNAYWIGMGDYTDCINYDDPRFDPTSLGKKYNLSMLSKIVDVQIDEVCSYLYPIRKKCLLFLTGNHEETIRIRYKRAVANDIAHRLGLLESLVTSIVKDSLIDFIPVGYCGFLQLRFKRPRRNKEQEASYTTYTIFAHHGFGSSRTPGPKVNRLWNMAHFMDADLILLGHEHQKVIAPPIEKLYIDKLGRLRHRTQYSCMSGSYLRGYVERKSTYVEKAAYAPSSLGTVTITLKPDTHEIKAEL